jgi:hypothetical protein
MGKKKETNGEIVARLDERIKTIFIDIGEIKDGMKDITKTITDNQTDIMGCGTRLTDHLDQHKRDIVIMGLSLGIITLVANLVVRVV